MQSATDPPFKKYTDLVSHVSDLTGFIREQGDRFIDCLNRIDELESMIIHAPYTWTLREVMAHLNDCERVHAYRVLWIARGGPMPLTSFDENEFALCANANRRTLRQIQSEFTTVRNASLSLLEGLQPSDWEKKATFIGYDVTVRTFATLIAGHAEHHWRVLQTRFPSKTA